MKFLSIPVVCVLLSGGLLPREESLIYAPEEGLELERTFTARSETSLEFALLVDDEEQELGEVPEQSSVWTETIVVTDEILEVEDGRPTDLRRTFDELNQESAFSAGDEEVESSMSSEFEGLTVRFVWDDEDEEYYPELEDEDEEIDEDLLEWLLEDMDLRGVLPEDEVEEGDSWELDSEVYLPLMWPGGLLAFYSDDAEGYEDDGDDRNQQTIENLEVEGTATFEEVREDDDGRRLAVISIELEATTSTEKTEERPAAEGETIDVEITEEIERSLEGEILWDLEANHLVSVDLEGDTEWVHTESATVEAPDGEHELAQARTSSGEISYKVEVESN